MNTKHTKWFEETAADPARRRAAISAYSRRRTLLICCALVITGCAVAIFFLTPQNRIGTEAFTIAASFSWISCASAGSDLRTLKLLDRFLP